jgi:hypothetical protein
VRVSAEPDAEQIGRAVAEFREALGEAIRPGTRNKIAVMRKDAGPRRFTNTSYRAPAADVVPLRFK